MQKWRRHPSNYCEFVIADNQVIITLCMKNYTHSTICIKVSIGDDFFIGDEKAQLDIIISYCFITVQSKLGIMDSCHLVVFQVEAKITMKVITRVFFCTVIIRSKCVLFSPLLCEHKICLFV
jgi:hypothetical protein